MDIMKNKYIDVIKFFNEANDKKQFDAAIKEH
jgi:hypothetical protein